MSLSNYSATGNIGRDVETRAIPSGSTVATFPLAITTGFGDRQKTMWVRCNLWGNRATGGLIQYLVKGQSVAVSGELSENAFTGNDGIEKKSLELNVNSIDLIGSKKEGGAAAITTTTSSTTSGAGLFSWQ
ncbi:MAG TPA: single-stranded DNA-binding protein [Methylophaga sp.]|jgi:single-strand DNA-binding protein|uniref:single-stranded DNA-binding protein n=1 Tax=unclassified Methylophaga TaxID=2629249 RepID=UPI000C978A7B|nr:MULTISPECIES: single-stranded DNA-binding protein [unclassified Methylophaga]MAP27748.1 single-stranded DNA-binding protein [Methylophaga sp.]HAD32194.1 single-stranded DNA-binding protein [Methylophaga sp.]HBX59859.1 single-stranded DNA-binding protein [Methylophaga sp.]|tara:strand:+ start:2107 stop:2499 length:393 start_codon:yes stop_codon:yes gene_type:complete